MKDRRFPGIINKISFILNGVGKDGNLMRMYRKTFMLALFLLLLFFIGARTSQAYEVRSNYKQLSKKLTRLRSLKFKKQVPLAMKTRSFIRNFLIKTLKEELSGARLEAFDSTLKVFGFVSEDFNTWNFILDLYSEQIAGMYDYKTGTMFLLKGGLDLKGMEEEIEMMRQMGIRAEDMLLIHEMQHALQDQYFDLNKIISRAEKTHNDDYLNAVQALIEGDASLVMMLYAFDRMGETIGGGAPLADLIDISQMRELMGDSPMYANQEQFSRSPLFFKRTLLFPYLDGMIFVDTLRKRGGWTLVNEAFRKTPKSTEQILHPQKYISRDNPIIIKWIQLPKSLGNWKMIDENVAGELVIRILFEDLLPEYNHIRPSAGWGGDTYRIYKAKGKGKRCLVWFTSWDSKKDSREFFESYLKLLKKKHPRIKWQKRIPGKVYLGVVDGKSHYLAIRGKDVAIMEYVPQKYAWKVLNNIWAVNKREWK